MSTSTLFTVIFIVTILASVFTRMKKRPPARPQPPVVSSQPSRKKAKKKKTSPARQQQPANRAAGMSDAQVRAILKRALDATWLAEQDRLRAQVLEQERKIAARLRQGQRELDFTELRTLHRSSQQTADLAYASLGGARSTENAISENIRNTHRAIEAEQHRGGRGVPAMRQALDALHLDRDVIRTYRERYEKDLTRLNQETGRLRDAIGAQCGAEGRRWHQALAERTRARKVARR
jgi:hypothetical protein